MRDAKAAEAEAVESWAANEWEAAAEENSCLHDAAAALPGLRDAWIRAKVHEKLEED